MSSRTNTSLLVPSEWSIGYAVRESKISLRMRRKKRILICKLSLTSKNRMRNVASKRPGYPSCSHQLVRLSTNAISYMNLDRCKSTCIE